MPVAAARFEIPTSDGKLRPAHRAGIFAFDSRGSDSLTAYTFAGGDGGRSSCRSSMRPAARETYGAGRTSTSSPRPTGRTSLDFNLAYHPSCVYDPGFSCPLTPAENRLPVRIEAGERLPSLTKTERAAPLRKTVLERGCRFSR